ncbi:hypothetical protein EV643_11773 [Kribbella sp. VKM Ac-2527]|uniref:Uncharacterized protein n=1 Tax=Kribbella caucasensis TaxID=2512215 RepID=A0A4R6K433_9ACTN|nr:hypothetical protein [Kribbella sp. VKM Ac-2527]TDO44050.1 hypothetical protein EV643_11773 [Kribbella sp. VKM Ac-2527]
MEAVAPEDWPCGSLTTIIDVDLQAQLTYESAVRLWFELMTEPVFGDLLHRHRHGDERVSADLYTVYSWGIDEHHEPFGDRSLDRLLKQVDERGRRPEWVLLAVEEESDNGLRVPGATGDCFSAALAVRCLEESREGAHFSASGTYWSPDLVAPAAVQADWCRAVKRFASQTAAAFANISDDNERVRTALDSALDRSEAESITMSRSVLRGYSWVTVCGSELVGRLGGASALEASGAFWRVHMFDHDAAYLQATERLNDYDSAAIERVFRALSPVLPAGVVKPTWGNDWPRLVHDDASRYH